MLTLTRLLRTALADQAGSQVGRPAEVIADRSHRPPLVTGVEIRGRRMRLGPGLVVQPGAPQGDLLLVRDVLDVQVLDNDGHHRGRVGDVELAQRGDGRLTVVAVETGLGPVLRRLRLGRLAARASSDRLEWPGLHPQVGRTHAYRAELANRPRRFRGVLRARRRPPR
jgi:hypothetical protein